jgi:hypothetical protein
MEVAQLRQQRDVDQHAFFSSLNKAAQMLTLSGNYHAAEVGWVWWAVVKGG